MLPFPIPFDIVSQILADIDGLIPVKPKISLTEHGDDNVCNQIPTIGKVIIHERFKQGLDWV
jgi:hypothetical protein